MHNKILLVTSIYPPQSGGPAIFTKRFGDWLENKGFDVCTVSYQVDSIENSKNHKFIKLGPLRIFSFIKLILTIKRNSNESVLILANGAFIETYIACLFSRRKFFTKIPGDHAWEIARNRGWTKSNIEEFQFEKVNVRISLLRALRNRAFKSSKFVIAPSYQLQNFLIDWGIPKEKTEVIFNCVNPLEFKPDPSTSKKYDLVTVCRLVPWKGLEELIQCAKLLKLSLVIIGDGPLRSKLENMVLTTEDKIKFMGNLKNSQIAKTLNQSRIFVLNSQYEATSYALIEAKMSGLPVVARENNGSSSVIQNDVDGLLVSNDRKKNLTECIRSILFDDVLLTKFSREAREDALARFNQETNFSKILEILKP